VVLVGQAGVTDAVVRSVDAALGARELIKVRLHEPEDKHAAAEGLAARTGAALCGLVGHTVILYRPHAERPVIVLP
jgi:RNA-binding protein